MSIEVTSVEDPLEVELFSDVIEGQRPDSWRTVAVLVLRLMREDPEDRSSCRSHLSDLTVLVSGHAASAAAAAAAAPAEPTSPRL